jgi:hypothetical protein
MSPSIVADYDQGLNLNVYVPTGTPKGARLPVIAVRRHKLPI